MMTFYLFIKLNSQSFKFPTGLFGLLPFIYWVLQYSALNYLLHTCFAKISSYCEVLGDAVHISGHYYDDIFKMLGTEYPLYCCCFHVWSCVSLGVNVNCKETENYLQSILIMYMWRYNVMPKCGASLMDIFVTNFKISVLEIFMCNPIDENWITRWSSKSCICQTKG